MATLVKRGHTVLCIGDGELPMFNAEMSQRCRMRSQHTLE